MKIKWDIKEDFKKLESFLKEEYKNYTIFPPKKEIFSALSLNPEDVKVVILGQDPYHGSNQANGRAFAVKNGVRHPPSLKNIYKELKSDLGIDIPKTSSLEGWQRQGVLLLNTILTVRQSQPLSHQGKWEELTDKIIKQLSSRKEPVIFILWGGKAQVKRNLIAEHHHILSAPHPSPLSAHSGFFGCKHFSKVNEILKILGKDEIDWSQID